MLTISVITAVYNRADHLQDALSSLYGQTYSRVEHIVIDGASTDGTMDVLRAHRDKISVLVSEGDDGIYDALNKGIARATGDVIGFLNSDDFYADSRVLERVAAAFSDPEVAAVYGDLNYVAKDDTSRIIRYWHAGAYSSGKLAWGWMPPHPTLYVRRWVYDQLGAFDTQYRIAGDYDAILRFLGAGGIRPAYIPEVLVNMRVGGESNRSLTRLLRKSYEDYLILRRNKVGGLGALVWKNLSKLTQFN